MRAYISKGFTLIELLVVISIISTLASVVLASLQNARDKGRIAADVLFYSTNYHAHGDDELARYIFQNQTGADSTIHHYDLINSSLTYSNTAPVAEGFAVTGGTANVSFPPITLSEYTMSFWVNPQSGASVVINFESNTSYLGEFGVFGSSLVFYSDFFGWSSEQSLATIPLNKWTLVTCSYDSTGKLTCYVDGKIKSVWTGGSTNFTGTQAITVSVSNASIFGLDFFTHALDH